VLFFTIYFLLYQILNIYVKRLKYFLRGSFWNFCDLICYILIVFAEFIHITNQGKDALDGLDCATWQENLTEELEDAKWRDYTVTILYSICTYLVWLRAVYFFRLNRSTGYFIRMIIEVTIDMKNFLLIFLAVVAAFAHSYLLLFRNNENDDGFQEPLLNSFWEAFQMTYLTPMGDYNTDFQSIRTNLGWIYFIVATLFLNTMLLNVLISIISDTFARIQESYKVIMYYDLLNVINENQIIYRGWTSDWLSSKYLFFTDPVEEEKESEPVLNKLAEIQDENRQSMKIQMETAKTLEAISKISEKEKYILERIEKLETMLETLTERSDRQQMLSQDGIKPQEGALQKANTIKKIKEEEEKDDLYDFRSD